MKIYLIHNVYNNGEDDAEHQITVYASPELAEQAIQPMIEDEIKVQIDNGKIKRTDDNKIVFVHSDGTETVEISPTRLSLSDGWGWYLDLWIEEQTLITEI